MPFEPNPPALREILASDAALAFVSLVAELGAELARDNMPTVTGHSREHVVSGGAEVVDGVATAYFGSSSPVWHLVEYGSVNNPPYRPFRRAAEQLGLDFQEE